MLRRHTVYSRSDTQVTRSNHDYVEWDHETHQCGPAQLIAEVHILKHPNCRPTPQLLYITPQLLYITREQLVGINILGPCHLEPRIVYLFFAQYLQIIHLLNTCKSSSPLCCCLQSLLIVDIYDVWRKASCQ